MHDPAFYNPSVAGQPQPSQTRMKGWVIGVLIGVGMVVLLCIFGTVLSMSGEEPKISKGSSTGQTPVTDAPVSPTLKPSSSAPVKAKPKGLPSTFGDGTFTAGKHIKAGNYRTPGASEDIFNLCTWTIENKSGNFIDGGSGNTGEPGLAKLRTGDTITVHGCEPWVVD